MQRVTGKFLCAALALALTGLAGDAMAQSGYPRKPILMLVPLQAASAGDNAPDVREKLVAQGFTVLASSPEELSRTTRDQLDRYGKLFKQAGIKAD